MNFPICLFRLTGTVLSLGAGVVVGLMGILNAAVTIPPVAPSGFSSPTVSSAGFGQPTSANVLSDDSVLRGFSFSASLGGTYDSNVTQSPGGSVAPVQDDFILSLGGTINYLSKSSGVTFGGRYHGTYNEYFSQADFSGYSQGASGVVSYTGGRLSVSLASGIDYDEGSNRNYASAFVKRTNIGNSLTASYLLSRKTSLQGYITQSYSSASGGNFGDTEALDVGASALWKYSPLTELGPGVRYTYRTGSLQDGRSSVGPTLNLNYKLSTKVALTSRVGMDFARYDSGGSADPTVSAAIGLTYEASRLWGMDVSLFRDTQADPALAGNYTELTSFRVGYHHRIRRATLVLGTGFDTNRSQTPSGGGVGNDRNYFVLSASLGMMVLSNTTFASISTRYADQSGDSANSWDSVQMGFSLSRSF